MSDIYDVLEKQMNKESTMIPKDEFAAQMKERRDDLNSLVDSELDKIKTSPEAYLNYLDKQSTFDQYTVSNTLLIMAQKPEATQIKAIDKWREEKCFIRKGEKGFTILEPKDDYRRNDGSMGKNYRMKTMFDISQLQKVPYSSKAETLKVNELVSAMLYKLPVEAELVDSIKDGKDVFYSMADKKIFATRDLTPQQLLTGLARESCFAEIDPHQADYTREDLKFSALSSAYMLCKKYGIEAPSTDFAKDVSSYLGDLDNKDVKSYLSGFKETFDDVSKRMESGLYAQSLGKEKEPVHDEVGR